MVASAPEAPDCGQLADELRTLQDYEGGITIVDEVTVFSSELSPAGPVYEMLATAPLSAR